MATILITGANRGIGLELSRQLHERGDQVIALCRQASPELEALGVRIIDGVDITDDATLAKASEKLGDTEVDVLINNAGIGIFTDQTSRDLDFAEMQHSFDVNALGPLRVTRALEDKLARSGKIILITSRMGSIGDNGSGGYYGYRMSKAALNMAGVNLAHDFRTKGIAVAILHPGMVATRMTGFSGISTEESAAGLIARIDELRLEDSGGFWHANGEELPW